MICSVFVHSGQNLSFPLLLGKERIRVGIYHPYILGATLIGQLVYESVQVCANFLLCQLSQLSSTKINHNECLSTFAWQAGFTKPTFYMEILGTIIEVLGAYHRF